MTNPSKEPTAGRLCPMMHTSAGRVRFPPVGDKYTKFLEIFADWLALSAPADSLNLHGRAIDPRKEKMTFPTNGGRAGRRA
jgi:hypothetical protein